MILEHCIVLHILSADRFGSRNHTAKQRWLAYSCRRVGSQRPRTCTRYGPSNCKIFLNECKMAVSNVGQVYLEQSVVPGTAYYSFS